MLQWIASTWHLLFDSLKDATKAFLAEIILTIIGALVVILRDHFARDVQAIYHAGVVLLTRRHLVLVWADIDDGVLDKLCERLATELPEYRVHALDSPQHILRYPRFRRFLAAVVLIDTDVTKLDSEDESRSRIDTAIRSYLRRGGGVVGTHDIIYRRVRSVDLQRHFGGTVQDFKRTSDGVGYHHLSAAQDDPLAADLPAAFKLDDGEIVWGHWESDCRVHYETADAPRRPLVVSRSYHGGRTVWLNSGDTGTGGLCRSIGEPQPNFVLLLRNAIRWVGRSDRARTHPKAAAAKNRRNK